MKKCSACDSLGFRLMDNDVHGLRIEKCDVCETFNSDKLAVEYVFGIAKTACIAALPISKAEYDKRHKNCNKRKG